MGKLLLKSNNTKKTSNGNNKSSNHSARKDPSAVQTTLTDSYSGYFRIGKKRPVTEKLKLCFQLGASTKLSVGNNTDKNPKLLAVKHEPNESQMEKPAVFISEEASNHASSPITATVGKEPCETPCRKSRWDIRPTSCDKPSNADKSPSNDDRSQQGADITLSINDNAEICEDADMDSIQDDDLSSLSSLQSEDDVLGPWIELGLIDPHKDPETSSVAFKDDGHPSVQTQNIKVEMDWCSDCDILRTNDRQPFDIVPMCQKCKREWAIYSKVFLSDLKEQSHENKRRKRTPPKEKVKARVKPTEFVPSTNCSAYTCNPTAKPSPMTIRKNLSTVRRTRPVKRSKAIPPTKSRNSRTTDKRMAQKQLRAKVTRKSQKTSKSNVKDTKQYESILKDDTSLTGIEEATDRDLGFHSNIHGFTYQQQVEVLNINGHWYRGVLTMMHEGKVKVSYLDWDNQHEWIIMGSQRLRPISSEDTEEVLLTNEKEGNTEHTATLHEDKTSAMDDEMMNDIGKDKPQAIQNEYMESECCTLDTEIDPHTCYTDTNEETLQHSIQHSVLKGVQSKDLLTIGPKSRANNDYVSSTLDTDPSHIFNDNEVFMTRRMARELIDEYGFKPNSFGYRYNRAVAVTFKGPKKAMHRTMEWVGYLREMRKDEVRVWYPTLSQSEWFRIGSRRLRVLTEEEEALFGCAPDDPTSEQLELTDDADNMAEEPIPDENVKSDTETQKPAKQRSKGKKTLEEAVEIVPAEDMRSGNDPEETVSMLSQENIELETSANTQSDGVPSFLTTGAFATRRAMRQLKDEHGFVPNPYGYAYNLAVEILNTRSSRKKFWERGHLVAMQTGKVKVRYDGWSEVYDEWIMVGSRRIRLAPSDSEISPSTKPCTSFTTSQDTNNGTLSITKNDLLITEANPELADERKKNRQRRLLGPEDYLKLGLLVNESQISQKSRRGRPSTKASCESSSSAPKAAASQSSTGQMNEDGDFYETQGLDEYDFEYAHGDDHDYSHNPRKGLRKTKKELLHQKRDIGSSNGKLKVLEAPVIPVSSRRLAQSKRTEHDFIANVYGYDYMQHVQVLHLDKRWYEGRLVSMERKAVRVHYCGWPDAFDEKVRLGSRRLQVIENDHEVLCIEPNYRERFETLQQQQTEHTVPIEMEETLDLQETSVRRNIRRLTLSSMEEIGADQQVEYHKLPEDETEIEEIDNWKVYCNQCKIVIKQFRYYCTYCETPSEGYDYQSFELCLQCFDQNFPFWHEHPRSSFAVQAVIDTDIGPMPIKGELVTVWEEDVLEATSVAEAHGDDEPPASAVTASQIFTGAAPIDIDQGYKYLKRWQKRTVCAFCNDDDDTSEELGHFIGPFVIATFNKNGAEKKRSFWAHDACARYSPEVFCTPDGKWYNVTLALRRGRGMRCYVCKEKGATIGCFESKCNKSFHLFCAQKPVSYFKNGVIFWCPTHEAYYNKKDTYVNIFKCDGCEKQMEEESWFTCLPCASSYFSSYDLCSDCFEKFPADHAHDEDQFEETSFAIIKEMEAQKAIEAARAKEEARAHTTVKKRLFPKRQRRRPDGSLATSCCYCGTYDAEEWRKGYDGGVLMCKQCFDLALLIDSDGKTAETPLIVDAEETQKYVTSIDDYTHKPYLTRDALSVSKFSHTATGPRLTSYEPQPNQLFSLVFDSTYYDIPGRAPRWASHSGTDYHGTWLPQTVRRAILKYTAKNDRVLSNFLGRGTDAIECFLLKRRCVGLDINPAAVALAQRNCCFEIPAGLTSAEYRPIVAQADARQLSGALFADDSFDHILSHPPYKDCVAYSTHLEGDLSRFINIEDFKQEYQKVVHESWRLLKMGHRVTLGIGDNREHCFYIPVGFHLIRQYIDNGFELEELIIKRQRYCSAFGLGTYLCVQYDFLVFTHEFIATFRKIPLLNINRMTNYDEMECSDHVRVTHIMKGVPTSAIARKSVVMGTVWVFKPTDHFRFEQLCVSRMVERFGKDDGNWELVQLDFMSHEVSDTLGDNQDDPASLSAYEQERLKRIEENNKTLLKLGLISELSEESDDVIHYETMMTKEPIEDAPLVLMVVGHQQIEARQIGLYRESIVQIAMEATKKLAPQGMLVIGTRDIRQNEDGKLWPMTMLVLEDIERAVDRDTMKLKEMVVAVPDGYSKDRRRKTTAGALVQDDDIDIVDEHLPIVHAIYLIFQRL
ncbi:uncharacterized protein BYT42DRAFT_593398 [Radiomyces spectabilis]|uniref:uncharacterized protein n=1 Tax=Radiomyces spectabilis TaxID=64574 RepID=UPI002220EE92|nr:uncharacterized protein BYT42DRAFT_593398 [Radiomyces spectabilis]KAI8379148.1 hypothetical protein BYT42DRAFT_593398 [Radiomyces spectabilis]